MKFGYDSRYFPPAPVVEIQLATPDEVPTIGPLLALVDTGADMTIIPSSHIEPLDLQADDQRLLRSHWGEARKVDIYLLDLVIGDLRFPVVPR